VLIATAAMPPPATATTTTDVVTKSSIFMSFLPHRQLALAEHLGQPNLFRPD
jgi:hypothetical protein